MSVLTCDEVRDLAAGYVLGALEPDEAAGVAAHLATCPEAHEEIAELGGLLPYLGDSIEQVEPPAGLRDRVMAAAARDLTERWPAGAPGAKGSVAPSEPIAFRPRRSIPRRAWFVGLAAALAVVALGAWNLRLQADLSAARQYQDQLASVLALGSQAGARLVPLNAAPGTVAGPRGVAALSGTGPGSLVMAGLAPTEGGQVYEAWVIVDGGAPAPAGWFTVGPAGTGYLSGLRSPSTTNVTVAITLESKPDPPAPTLPILSSGATSS